MIQIHYNTNNSNGSFASQQQMTFDEAQERLGLFEGDWQGRRALFQEEEEEKQDEYSIVLWERRDCYEEAQQ